MSSRLVITKLVDYSPLAESQRTQYYTTLGEKYVKTALSGIEWVVAHDPFQNAEPVDGQKDRWVSSVTVDTPPQQVLTYVFLDADVKRRIMNIRFDSL